MRRAKAMKGDDAAYSTSRMRKPTLGAARQTYRGRKKTRREHNEMMEGIILGIEAKFLQENKDKCGPGEYWCTKDMKCKPIPKGMTTDKDGMLVKESFKHYEVTHKPTGKKYKVTAMHDKSAKEKARAQHGGTASRYSGTSTDDFHTEEKMAGVEYYPRIKAHGKMTAAQKKAVTAVYDKKKVDKKMSDDPHVKKAQRYMKVEQAINELYPSHNTGTIDMDKHATPEQKKARADFAKKREAFAKKYPNASTSEKMFAKLRKEYYDMHHGEDPSDASITRKTDPGKKGDPKPYGGKYKKDPKTGKMMPKFAMDGKGKMNMGGMAKKKMGMSKGGSRKKKMTRKGA